MADTPVYFALPPLYPSLVSRAGVAIQLLNPSEPLKPVAVVKSYQAVDAEPWAQRFLADVDHLGTDSFLDVLGPVPALQDALSRLTAARTVLADRIAGDLAILTTESSAEIEASLSKARALLARQLKASLTQGYATSVLVRQKATDTSWVVSAPATPALSARGAVVASTVLFDAALAEVTAALTVQAVDQQIARSEERV